MLKSKFWREILSSKDPTSSKRLITLIISLHFILASFLILFIAFYVIFYTPKGKVDKDLIDLLREVLGYDDYIILAGLGFVTVDGLGKILVEKERAKAQNAYSLTPDVQDITNTADTNTKIVE